MDLALKWMNQVCVTVSVYDVLYFVLACDWISTCIYIMTVNSTHNPRTYSSHLLYASLGDIQKFPLKTKSPQTCA